MALQTPRAGLRLVNQSKSVAKFEIRLEPGEEIEVPDGSIVDADHLPAVKPVKKEKPAPTKKAAASHKSDD